MRATWWIPALVTLAACGASDPCAGKAGVCIALRVEGSIADLDQLEVTIDQPVVETQRTAQGVFSLPVQLALNMPAGTTGMVHLGVVGLAGGTPRAEGSAVATMTGNRGQATVTLLAGVVGDDLGVDGAVDLAMPGDLASCSNVTTCQAGDGCCPAGCNGANDADCPSVCGNGVTEPGEVCDDQNATNGDGCDATCQWRGSLTRTAGNAGGAGHADDSSGAFVRFDNPTAMAAVASDLFVAGADNVIRKVTTTGAGATTPVAGQPYVSGSADGALASASFSGIIALEYISSTQQLYVIDGYGASIRQVDLLNSAVTTLTGNGITLTSGAQGLGQFNGNLLYFDKGVGVVAWNGSTTSIVVSLSALQAVGVASQPSGCSDIACDGTSCYMACQQNIVKFPGGGGTVANYAGTYIAGSWSTGCTDSAALGTSTFSLANQLDIDVGGNVLVADQTCATVRRINSGVARLAGTTSTNGWRDGTVDAALFSGITGVAHVGSSVFVVEQTNNDVRQIAGGNVGTLSGRAHLQPESAFSSTPTATPNFDSFLSGLTSDGTYVYAVDNQARALKIAIADGATTLLNVNPPGAMPLNAVVRVGTTLYLASAAGGFVMTAALDGTSGTLYAGTPGTNSPPMNGARLSAVIAPSRMATNGTQLFFTENSTLVRAIDLGSGMVSTLAGTVGTTDVVDETGTAAHFARAGALAADASYVYVADGVNFGPGPPPTCVRRIEIATGKVETIFGVPDAMGHVDDVGAAARFAGIAGLVTDGANLFVTEGGSYVVKDQSIGPTLRQLHLSDRVVTTIIGRPGQYSFRPDTGTVARVNFPGALTFDSTTHSLFFYDQAEYVLGRVQ